jgi:hypothetical protein
MSQVRVILSKLGMLRFWEAALEGRLSTLKQKGLQFYHPADPFHLAHPSSNTHSPWQNWSESYVTTDNLGSSCLVCGNSFCPYLSASTALRSEFASWALLWLQVPVPICLWSFAQKVHHFVTDKKYSIGASNKLQLLLKSVQITGLLILRLLDPQNL